MSSKRVRSKRVRTKRVSSMQGKETKDRIMVRTPFSLKDFDQSEIHSTININSPLLFLYKADILEFIEMN